MTTNPRRNDDSDSSDDSNTDEEENSTAERWPLTPLISAADIPRALRRTIRIPEQRLYPLLDHGRRRVENGANGTRENHELGILGEFAVASHLGIPDAVDTNLYERGDGGIDLRWNGHTLDVKTVGRHRSAPALTVDQYQSLEADYYILVSRIGETAFEIIGYAPQRFVRYAKFREHEGRRYHYVPQEDLFPMPQLLR